MTYNTFDPRWRAIRERSKATVADFDRIEARASEHWGDRTWQTIEARSHVLMLLSEVHILTEELRQLRERTA